jgi:hypothetical protein
MTTFRALSPAQCAAAKRLTPSQTKDRKAFLLSAPEVKIACERGVSAIEMIAAIASADRRFLDGLS